MSIISTLEATPNRLKLIFSYLDGIKSEEKKRLLAIAGPKPLRARVEQSGGNTVAKPVAEALQMGLLVEDGERIRVARNLSPDRRRLLGFDEAFSEHVEDLLFDTTSPGWNSQRTVAPAIAWLLIGSPRRPFEWSGNPRTLLTEQLGEGDNYLLTNPANWQNFAYWARALGYCTFIGVGAKQFVVPDPTAALRRHLREILPDELSITIAETISRVAQRCPVLEQGWAREEVEARSVLPPREHTRLSETTSFALRRLASAGDIKLLALPDAEVRVLNCGDAIDRVSHIAKAREF